MSLFGCAAGGGKSVQVRVMKLKQQREKKSTKAIEVVIID